MRSAEKISPYWPYGEIFSVVFQPKRRRQNRMFSYAEPAFGLTFFSVHGVGVELEEKLDAGFEQRVVFESGVGGEELFGGGLRLVQER